MSVTTKLHPQDTIHKPKNPSNIQKNREEALGIPWKTTPPHFNEPDKVLS